jgi:HSP20 family protein
MTVMTSWDLFDDLRNAQDELVRMSRTPGQRSGQISHFGQQQGMGYTTQAWAPVIDITERKDAYMVAAELPGVSTGDVEITVQHGLLTIQGERHPAGDTATEKVHRAERRYGAFRRSITLPSHVQADKIEASAQDGVLLILVPKAAEAHAKRIQVSVGKDSVGKDKSKSKATVNGTVEKNGR